MLKKLALPAAIGYTILLTILSLIKLNGVPEFGTDYDDKVYHVVAYCVLTSIWFFALKNKNSKKNIFYLASGCIAFGIIIEALQGKLTTHRVGDVLDIVANIVGVLLVIILILVQKKNLS